MHYRITMDTKELCYYKPILDMIQHDLASRRVPPEEQLVIFQQLADQWPGSRWNDECMKRVAVWEDLIGREYKLLVEMDKMGITKYKA